MTVDRGGAAQPVREAMYEQGHQSPDPEYVKALMLCVKTGVWSPSDTRRREEELPGTTLEGCVNRDADLFFPPSRLLLDGGSSVRRDQIKLWRQVANTLLWNAQTEAFSDRQIEALADGRRLGIENVRLGQSIRDHKEGLYFDLDTEKGHRSQDILREVEMLVADVKRLIEKELVHVMADRGRVDEVIHSAEVYRELIVGIVFREIIERIDFIRGRVENPDDVKRFYEMLTKAVRSLGKDGADIVDPAYDVEVIPLSSEDAVIQGCQGLYKPSGLTGGKPQIAIPFSRYGTSQLLTINEALEILAHELGHHLSETQPLADREAGGLGDHDLQHAHHEHAVMQRLRGMKFQWKKGGDKSLWQRITRQ